MTKKRAFDVEKATAGALAYVEEHYEESSVIKSYRARVELYETVLKLCEIGADTSIEVADDMATIKKIVHAYEEVENMLKFFKAELNELIEKEKNNG